MKQLRPFLKKFLVAYAMAVILVFIYYTIKIFFSEHKEIELKSFNRPEKVTPEVIQEDKKNKEDRKEQSSRQDFILLPAR